MTKYKLLKELPLAPVGTFVYTKPTYKDYEETVIYNDKCLNLAYINIEDMPLWLEEIEEKKSVWDIQYGDTYYYIYPCTGCKIWDIDSQDILNRDIGKCFLTSEEAGKELKKIKAIVKLNRIIDEKNGDWTPDWKNSDETKHSVYHHCYCNSTAYIVSYNTSSTYSNTIKYAKDKSTMDFIIDNHKDLLDIVFDIN